MVERGWTRIALERLPARDGGYPRPVTATTPSGSAASPALTVALDGPASSGKSSVGAAAAAQLGYRFCDTGLLYRAATWLALKRGVSADGDPAALVALVPEIALVPDAGGRLAHVSVDDVDVTDDVHTPIVDEHVSAVSRVPELRTALLERQRSLAAEPGGIIMAGRDIGTVVLPDADLKIFLDASVEERARRRTEERGIAADSPEARQILAQLRQRDELDRNRPVAPLRPAADAIHVVTDGNAFQETVAAIVAAIRTAGEQAAVGAASRT
jgi:cytidylate kinase